MKGFLALAANRLAALDPATTPPSAGAAVHLRRRSRHPGRPALHRELRRRAAAAPRASSSASPPSSAWSARTRGWCAFGSTSPGGRRIRGIPHLGRSAIEPAARAIVALAGAPAQHGSRASAARRAVSRGALRGAQRRHGRGRQRRQCHSRPLRDAARRPAAARDDRRRDGRAGAAPPSGERWREQFTLEHCEREPRHDPRAGRADPSRAVRGRRTSTTRTASCSPRTPDGSSAPDSSASSSARAASRWRTSRTSSCRSESSAGPESVLDGLIRPELRGVHEPGCSSRT